MNTGSCSCKESEQKKKNPRLLPLLKHKQIIIFKNPESTGF
jgi:hypothetical protein